MVEVITKPYIDYHVYYEVNVRDSNVYTRSWTKLRVKFSRCLYKNLEIHNLPLYMRNTRNELLVLEILRYKYVEGKYNLGDT